MELLLVLAILLTLGKKGGSPQELFGPFAQLMSGQNADKILESDLFKDVRILGMKPAEFMKAFEEFKQLLSALPSAAQPAAAASSNAAPSQSKKEDPLQPIAGIADENIERMLGKYFS